MILRDHLRVALAGLAAGIPLAILTGRVLGTALYGVEPIDPVSLGVGIAVPLLVALGAAIMPARRALRVDPVTALKAEG
jgi:ABC-type antimicrobial peptide transport system permease subunit